MPYFGNRIVVNPGYVQQQAASPPIRQPARPQPIRRIYSQKTTKNKSFLDMHHYLKSIGVKNNEFMLALIDPDLDGINPFDPGLNMLYKQKILRECMCNYWFFLREILRLPSSGSTPDMYHLDRGNLAYNFCASLNLNIYFEEPRQCGKTTAAIVRYLYCYNFGTTNSKMAFLHKDMDGSTGNLATLKAIRDLLPPYLIMKERVTRDGKVDKGRNNTRDIANPYNNNSIKTFASATTKAKAASLLRGKTLTIIWFDEYGFLPYNDIIYMNGAPAYKTASDIAKKNGAPYGILITSTPGFNTPEGNEAKAVINSATKFSETWYDKTYAELQEILKANTLSDFVYIKYNYQQLGKSEEWFNEVCKLLKNSWPDIRREILLEWSNGVENSPFREEDLDAISGLIKQPISEVHLLGKYLFQTYLQADTRSYPAIIGVDVAAGYKQDSSCITIIDSLTTKVLGCLNCNYISVIDLARCVEFIVKNWMPNAVINVERNGVGHGVIAKLLKMGLRRNMYYEIKDKTVEERQDGVHAYKHKVRVKEYGLNSTHDVRKVLIDILMERVDHHKDKFISPIIYNELLGMEIKRNGKVEHSNSSHDDQVFSMLMALYVWYEGVNLGERYGIRKTSIRTDEDIDEELNYYDDGTVEIVEHFNQEDDLNADIQRDLDAAIAAGGIPLDQYIEQRRQQEREQFEKLVHTPMGENAFRQTYRIPKDIPIDRYVGSATEFNVPDSVFMGFYDNTGNRLNDNYYEDTPYANVGAVPEGERYRLEGEDYRYTDHFNF